MQGQMRTTNILIRTAKHLGVITEEQIAGLKRQEGRLEAIRDIIEGIGETWQRAKKQMIISDVNTGFKMWRDTLVRIVSKSEELTSKQEGTLSIFGETAYEHFDRLSEKLDQVTDEELGNFLRVINYGFDKFLTLSENAVYFMGDVGDAIVENKKLADDLIDVFTDAGSLIKDTADESLTALNKALKATLKTLNSLAGLPGAGSSEGIIGTLLVGRMLGKWGRYISYLIVFDKIAGDLNEKLDKHWPFEGDAPYPLKMPTIGDFNDALDEANQGLTNLGQKMQGIRNESGDLTLFGKAMGAGNTDIYQRARAVSELRKRYDSIKDKIEKIRKIDQTKHPEKWQKGLREINKLQDELGVTERRLKLAEKSFDNATESANAFRKAAASKGGLDTFAKQKESVKKIEAAFDEASIKAEYFFDRLKDKVKAGETPADLTVEYAKQELNNQINQLESIKNRIEKNLSGYKDKFGKTPLYEEAKRQVAALNVNITDTQKKLKAVETGNFEDLVDLLEKSKKKTKDFNDVIRQYKEQNLDSYTSQLVSSLKSAGGAYEELAEQIVNNNLVWTDQKEILSGLTKEQKENLRTLLKLIRANKESEDLKERKKAIKEFNQEYRKTFMDSYDLERREIRKQAQEYKSQGIEAIRVAKWRKEELTRIAKEEAKAKLEASEYWKDGVKRGLNDIVDGYTDAAALMENATTSAFNSMTDSLVNFVMEGKFQWRDLARSILEELTRVYIKMEVIGRLASGLASMSNSNSGSWTGLLSEFGKGFGQAIWGSGGTTSGGLSTSSNFISSSGGHLNAYASGGLINEPVFGMGQKTGENYLIGESGPEYVTPARQMQNQSPPPITVQVINKTGEKADAKQGQTKWDGEKWVMSIVLDAANRNKGGFGKNLSAALQKQG
jgi:lambda family phage tail tape measure protein